MATKTTDDPSSDENVLTIDVPTSSDTEADEPLGPTNIRTAIAHAKEHRDIAEADRAHLMYTLETVRRERDVWKGKAVVLEDEVKTFNTSVEVLADTRKRNEELADELKRAADQRDVWKCTADAYGRRIDKLKEEMKNKRANEDLFSALKSAERKLENAKNRNTMINNKMEEQETTIRGLRITAGRANKKADRLAELNKDMTILVGELEEKLKDAQTPKNDLGTDLICALQAVAGIMTKVTEDPMNEQSLKEWSTGYQLRDNNKRRRL